MCVYCNVATLYVYVALYPGEHVCRPSAELKLFLIAAAFCSCVDNRGAVKCFWHQPLPNTFMPASPVAMCVSLYPGEHVCRPSLLCDPCLLD